MTDTPASGGPNRPTPTIRRFFLPPDQIERIREAGGPLADQPDLSRIRDASIPVVEVDGQIVAYWPVFYAVHAEPLWIAEGFRRHPGVVRGLLEGMQDAVTLTGEPVCFAIIDPTDVLAEGIKYAERLGFARVPGDLYYVVTDPAPTPVKG